MKRKIMAPMLAAALLLSNGITAFAAPEVINVDGINTVFDVEYYASVYPDVTAVLGTGRDAMVQHYTTFGKNENRAAYAPGTDVDALLAAAPATAPANPAAPVQKQKIKSRNKFRDGKLEESIEYDEQGNVLSKTSFTTIGFGVSGTSTTTYTYDEQGNVASKTVFEDNVAINTSFYTYDSIGNVLTETFIFGGGTIITTYTYDSMGNLVSEAWIDDDGSVRVPITYTYEFY